MNPYRTYNLNLILIIIFIITGGTLSFGFAYYNFSIPLTFFRVTESLAIIIYLLFVSFIISKKKIKYRTGIFKYYFYFLLLLLFIAIKDVVLLEVGLSEVIKKITSIYIVLLVFPLITLINTKAQVMLLIKALYFISLISAIVYLFQYSTGIELEASSGAIYDGIYRINHPGIPIITLVFFITLSHLLVFGYHVKYISYYIISALSLVVMILTLSRGYIIAVVLTVILMLYRSFTIGSSKVIIRGLFVVGLTSIFLVIYSIQNSDVVTILSDRMEEGVDDISDKTGTFDIRYEMIMIKISYIANNNPIIGVGFDYHTAESEEEALSREFYNNPTAMNGDSTYQNIAIVSGFLGLLLWLLNLFYLNKKGAILYKFSKDNHVKFLSLFASVLPLFILLHGFSSSYFSNSGFTILSLIMAFLYLAYSFELTNWKEK